MTTLLDYCVSDRQREIIQAYLKEGTARKAAKFLGANAGHVCRVVQKIKTRAALKGHSPEHDMTKTVPDPFIVKGTSTYYNKDGVPTGQWVKTTLDQERKEAVVREMCEALAESVARKAKPIVAPASADHDLLTAYLFADLHLGMYAWAEETGNDYNCEIAEQNLCAGIQRLVDRSPDSKEALLVNLGDFFHFDDDSKRTRASGHILDGDTRWLRVTRIGIRCLRYCVDALLRKHRKVTLINEIGNHDDQSAMMLNVILEAYYHNEPRLLIDTSPQYYHYYRFGKVLIGTHHGHKAKPADLGGIMATDRAKDWGETEFRYWFTGHIHHETSKEYRGYVHQSMSPLAALDVYSASNGYRSQRGMESVIFHREWGEEDRNRVGINFIQALANIPSAR